MSVRLPLAVRVLLLSLLLFLLLAPMLRAQDVPAGIDPAFPVTRLDTSLLDEDVSAIVRFSERRFDVQGIGKAVESIRFAVTVLGPQGQDQGRLVVPYSKLRRIKSLKGVIRRADGKVVRKLKKEDIEDRSAVSGFSLYEDNRVRIASLYDDAYPYTVVYEYELLWDGLLHWPRWYPQENGVPVEYAAFELDVPENMAVRHAARNFTAEPLLADRRGRDVRRWEVRALPAFEAEPYGPTWTEQAPVLYTATDAFEIEGSIGRMVSWRELGRWAHSLYDGRDVLPPPAAADVRALLANVDDEREKVRVLYEHLQATTRYVSIQIGLGGWQPFDATFVYEHGYGDCKALVNYMRALLHEAGIESDIVLIRAGRRATAMLTDFPSSQFNHVVLRVRLSSGEVVWLECTSQTLPFAHLGDFTEDRWALAVLPEGGELVRTPRSTATDNRLVRRATVRLSPGGDAAAEVHTVYAGNQYGRIRGELLQASGRDRDEWLHRSIDLPALSITGSDFSDLGATPDAFTLPVSLKAANYAARTGSRLFLRPNLFNRWTHVPEPAEDRTQPVRYFAYPFVHADTIRFELPPGYAIEALSDPVALESPAGRYTAGAELQPDGTLLYRRHLEITETDLVAEHYDALRDFLGEVARADQAQVVLVQQ